MSRLFSNFASTPVMSCISLLDAIACAFNMDWCHSDSERAFVESDLKEDVSCACPRGAVRCL